MTEDQRVIPALNAREWAAWTTDGGWLARSDCEYENEGKDDTGFAILSVDHRCAQIEDNGDKHTLMALANHALTDGHAGKITREDVLRIQSARSAIAGGGIAAALLGVDADVDGLDAGLERLAAKLAALLPPR